jgi:transitional endoplasmic reticulum ATPase
MTDASGPTPLKTCIDQTDTRGLVRMARADMVARGLHAGQTARLQGRRITHVRVLPDARVAGTLGVDATTAHNAGLEQDQRAQLVLHALTSLDHILLKLDEGQIRGPQDLADALFDLSVTPGDQLRLALPMGKHVCCTVAATQPDQAGLIGDATTIALETPAGVKGYETVGGLSDQIARVQEMIETPLRRPDLYTRLGLHPPRGVLFTGPPGSGKTLLARAVAERTKASFFQISGPEIITKHYGDSEASLRKVFEAAAKASPAIIFIDEIDAIAPQRAGLSEDKQVERRLVAQLLTLMDGLGDRGRVVVMAATNLPDALDSALRRPGRFDREIAFGPPNPDQRLEILNVHLAQTPLDTDVDLRAISARCHGYVGADLAALTREAAVAALTRATLEAGGEDALDPDTLFVTMADLEQGLETTSPSALRASSTPLRNVSWDDIGGLDDAKAALHRAVLWPLKHGDTLKSLRLAPARGVLLTGPPGSGKTLVARALASEGALNFVAARAPDLLSQYFGEAERAISALFRSARQSAPCLLFFDELDALAPRRSGQDAVLNRVVAQLLVEIDGIGPEHGLVVLAATNRAAGIDPALIRPGRFDTMIAFPLPDSTARTAILGVHFKNRPLEHDVDLGRISSLTDGASGADLATLTDDAARQAMERCLADPQECIITNTDIDSALELWHAARENRATDFITSKRFT